MIYLDNGATSFPKPDCVADEVFRVIKTIGANAGRSGHKMAIAASDIVYNCREAVCDVFHCGDPSLIAFTYNTTYALNMGIKGTLSEGDHVIISSMEHNSVIRPVKTLADQGVIEYTIIEADENGYVDKETVKNAIRPNTKLICITHVSNICGSINDIGAIGQIAKENNIIFMVDTAQSAGIIPIDVQAMHIDILAFAGHKTLFGPQGTGGIYVSERCELKTILEGGTGSLSNVITQPDMMPDRLESGTLNVPGIAGLSKGIGFIKETGIKNIYEHEMHLTKRLLDGLLNIRKVRVYGAKDVKNRTGVVGFNIEDHDCVDVAQILDQDYDIAVRSGLHCSYLGHKTMGTLDIGMIRISLGYFNTERDVDEVIRAINIISKK